MSNTSFSNTSIRELNARELDQVSGGLTVKTRPVKVYQKVPLSYTVQRVTAVLTQLVKKI